MLEWYETSAALCIAMDYFEHGTLHDSMSEITERVARSIMSQILKGLCYMHASDFIHRDLKPEVGSLDSNFQATNRLLLLNYGVILCRISSLSRRKTAGRSRSAILDSPSL